MKVKHDLFHNTTTNKPFSLESTREDGVTFSYRVVRDAVHSGKKWHSALWLKSVHSGKKWWIREFVPLLYILLKSWLCCCSLATRTPQQWHELRNPRGRRQPVGYLQSLIEKSNPAGGHSAIWTQEIRVQIGRPNQWPRRLVNQHRLWSIPLWPPR